VQQGLSEWVGVQLAIGVVCLCVCVCVVKMVRIYLNFVRGFINKQASPLFLVSIFDGACLLNIFSVAFYLSICVRPSVCLPTIPPASIFHHCY